MEAFLEPLDEDALTSIGAYVGGNIPRRAYLMKGVRFDEETALDHLLKILGMYDRWYRVSIMVIIARICIFRTSWGPSGLRLLRLIFGLSTGVWILMLSFKG